MKTAVIDKHNRKEARPGYGEAAQYGELLRKEKYWVAFRKQEGAKLRATLADLIYALSEPILTE